MKLTPRDRRALAFLAVSVILGLVYRFWSETPAPLVVAPADPVAMAEKRLAKLREVSATIPAKEDILKKVSADLAAREQGLIRAETAAQAQAQLIEMLRTLGRAESPPIEMRSYELGGIRPAGAYGEATVAVQIDCRIDQLVNLLAALGARPELVSLSDLRISSTNAKEKTVGARIEITGVVPRQLVPEKKGAGPRGGTAF